MAAYLNSPDRSTKSTSSRLDALWVLVNTRFQVLFHSPSGVLFTFPSQYFFSIGHWVVFWLGGWSPLLPTGFLVSRGTPDSVSYFHFFTWLSHSLVLFPNRFFSISTRLYSPYPKWISSSGLASFDFARHYFRNLGWLLFLALLRCFSSGGSPHIPMYSVYDAIFFIWRIPPFGYLWVTARLQLVTAFRS